jgi:hypothetical protein
MENMYYIKITTPSGVDFEVGFNSNAGNSAKETLKLVAEFVSADGMDVGMIKLVSMFMEAGALEGLDVRETDGSLEMTKGKENVQD